MYKSVFLLILIVTSQQAMPQESEALVKRPANNISLHLLGDGAIIAVYYERLFQISPSLIIAGSVGTGFAPEIVIIGEGDGPDYLALSHLTACLGKSKHSFEIGLGVTFVSGSTEPHTFFYPVAGYRLQPFKKEKVNFRAFASLPFNGTNDWPFSPVGVSVGIVF